MSRDSCPTCGLPWPNFCPRDGTQLYGPWTCPNAVDEAGDAPKAGADPSERETVLETPAVDPEQLDGDTDPADKGGTQQGTPSVRGRARTGGGSSDSGRARAKSTLVDPQPAAGGGRSTSEAERSERRGNSSKGGERKLSPEELDQLANRSKQEVGQKRKRPRGGATLVEQEAPRRGGSSSSDEGGGSAGGDAPSEASASSGSERKGGGKPASGKSSGKPASGKSSGKPASGKGSGSKGGGKGGREFSETQWFMKGVKVEDPDLLESVDETEYQRDESIPEEERQAHSLRRKSRKNDEEDDT